MSLENSVTQLEQTNANLVTEVTRIRDATAGLNNIYTTTAEGIAGVADGKYFVVPGNGTFFTLYRRNGSSADEIAEYPSRDAMDAAVNAAADNAEARATVEADRAFTEANRAEVYADNKGFVTREQFRRSASFDLDFARGKYLVDGGELTETTNASEVLTVGRATPKWVFGPNGKLREVPPNTAARSWNPETGECEGVLIEESRTNLLTYSEQFDNGAWTKTRFSVSPNSSASPNGETTADTISYNAIGSQIAYIGRPINISGTRVSLSIYVKNATDDEFFLGLREPSVSGNTFSSATFNLFNQTFTLSNTSGLNAEAAIVEVGSGWHLISFSRDTPESGLYNGFISPSYVSDDVKNHTAIIWGAQLEEGPVATSYIPTAGAAVTRAADNVSRTLGTEFNASEGTVVIDFAFTNGVLADNSDSSVFEIGGLSGLSLFFSSVGGGRTLFRYGDIASTEIYYDAGISELRLAVVYDDIEAKLYINGFLEGTVSKFGEIDGSFNILGGNRVLNGFAKEVNYYPYAMTAAQLKELTAL